MFAFGTQRALLKTYAVAPGTGLLVQTRQLTSEATVRKRAEDTSVIPTEFLVGSMDSDRSSKPWPRWTGCTGDTAVRSRNRNGCTL
jgi:hypothetical protein